VGGGGGGGGQEVTVLSEGGWIVCGSRFCRLYCEGEGVRLFLLLGEVPLPQVKQEGKIEDGDTSKKLYTLERGAAINLSGRSLPGGRGHHKERFQDLPKRQGVLSSIK